MILISKEEKFKRLKYALKVATADQLALESVRIANPLHMDVYREAMRKKLKAEEKLRRFLDKNPHIGF